MGFFDQPGPSPPEDDDDPDEALVAQTQSVWLGGVVPTQFLLARSESAVLTLRDLTVFPDGFSFSAHVFIRRRAVESRQRPHSGVGPPMRPEYGDDGQLAPDVLRFGLEFPDGARVTSMDRWLPAPKPSDASHGLRPGGGGGSHRDHSSRYWAWPVPVGGPLAIACEWPEHGIPESRIELAAEVFSDALGQAHPIWPDWDGGLVHILQLGSGTLADGPAGG